MRLPGFHLPRTLIASAYCRHPIPNSCAGARLLHCARPAFARAATKKRELPIVEAPQAPRAVQLRPYQEECIQACLDAIAKGHTRIGVSSPTGSGKTTIFLNLISRLPPPEGRPHANGALVIVNSVELVRQTATVAKAMFPDLVVEVEQSQHVASGVADITVATYQTLLSPERREKFNPSMLKAVIVDEAHHAAARSYLEILSYFDPAIAHTSPPEADSKEEGSSPNVHGDEVELDSNSAVESSKLPIIGFSATFSRHDGLALGRVFQQIVYHSDFLQMIKDEWLCNIKYTTVKASLDLSSVKVSTVTGDFSPKSLAQVINTDTINKLVVQTWLDLASTRRSTLIFCVDIQHVADLTQAFRAQGVDARFIHSKMPAADRRGILNDFRQGKFPVLVNCAILVEGADMPNTDCVMLCRPTRSRNAFAQMIGRGLRLSPQTGKEDCKIIDFVDSISRVNGLVNLPTLFGLYADRELKDASIEDLEQAAAEEGEVEADDSEGDVPAPKNVTYTDYDNPFELVSHNKPRSTIWKLSPYAWVSCGNDTYILELLGQGYIQVCPAAAYNFAKGEESPRRSKEPLIVKTLREMAAENKGFVAFWVRTIPGSREKGGHAVRRPMPIITAPDLEGAIKGADTYVQSHILRGVPPHLSPLRRAASWRKQLVSASQLGFLTKRLKDCKKNVLSLQGIDENTVEKLDKQEKEMGSYTKGQAADIICRLRHGAQRAWETKLREKTARAVQAEKKARRKSQHVVKVGPLPA